MAAREENPVPADHPVLSFSPAPAEQRAIVQALEEEEEDGHHVYTVSLSWYHRWRVYVGWPVDATPRNNQDVSHDRRSRSSPSHPGQKLNANKSRANSDASSSGKEETSGVCGEKWSPSPVEMDLADDEKNMYVGERIWKCFVRWFGVANSHELDRRNWASDDKDFEICILSPYCGLIENAVKTFDISEESGYIEIQLRRIFRVSKSRSTRLWICEKARHARFQPLLNRGQEICFQDSLDHNKNYILALEVANLDDSWPTHVPGEPNGSLYRYSDLFDGGPARSSKFWDNELAETLDVVFSGISSELKETASGIVNTTKCIAALKESDVNKYQAELCSKFDKVEVSQAALEKRASELLARENALVKEQDTLRFNEVSFAEERQKFAEEVVRMHTVNKMQETRVKLNIGGHMFVTSTLTLTKESDSMLAAMFSGRHSLKQEEDGSYFLDRDGTHFRYVLNYLRDGNFRPGSLSINEGFLGELYAEAEYYQLSGLMKLIELVIQNGPEGSGQSPEGSPRSSTSAIVPGAITAGRASTKRMQRKIMHSRQGQV